MDRSTQFVLTAFGTVGEPVVLRQPLQRGCCRLSLLPEFDRQCQGGSYRRSSAFNGRALSLSQQTTHDKIENRRSSGYRLILVSSLEQEWRCNTVQQSPMDTL